MRSFLELVQKRRSCRRYCSRPVLQESVERCLEAARLAPSACNSQPWRFIIVEDSVQREILAQKAFSGIHAMNAFAQTAPVLVVVVRTPSKYASRLGSTLRGVSYSLIDIGIAVEHFMLQAVEEGLETCWIGWFNERAVKKILHISHRERVDIVFPLGYSDEGTGEKTKGRKLLSEISEFR